MIVRTIQEIENTDREVQFKEGKSLRLILEKDNMGFSFHKTLIRKGTIGHWHYKNHLESCFCVSGHGVLRNLTTQESFNIIPDTIYLLDQNDDHTFEAITDVILLSVFNPPCKGGETHREDGSYE